MQGVAKQCRMEHRPGEESKENADPWSPIQKLLSNVGQSFLKARGSMVFGRVSLRSTDPSWTGCVDGRDAECLRSYKQLGWQLASSACVVNRCFGFLHSDAAIKSEPETPASPEVKYSQRRLQILQLYLLQGRQYSLGMQYLCCASRERIQRIWIDLETLAQGTDLLRTNDNDIARTRAYRCLG